MSNQVLFNELPRPTFRWLQVNHTEGQVWGDRTAVAPIVVDAKAGIVSPIANPQPLKPAYAGANKSVLDAVMNATGDSYAIKVPSGAKESVKVAIKVEASHTQADARFLVEAGKDSQVEILFYLAGNTKEASTVQLFTEVAAQEGAKVTIKKVQLLGDKVQHIEHRYTRYADKADVTYLNVEVGSAESYLNYEQDLKGLEASVKHDLAYIGGDEQRFDIAMLMTHEAKKSYSDIHTLGALSGKSKKSFRGTLDFLKGSSGSEGAEEDTCLLLDPTVHSVSLPLLLCKEDDVVGNHAAGAGQIDQTKLFYLMSRGFSETEAKHMIVESMIRPVIDRIGDEAIEEEALAAVRAKI